MTLKSKHRPNSPNSDTHITCFIYLPLLQHMIL